MVEFTLTRDTLRHSIIPMLLIGLATGFYITALYSSSTSSKIILLLTILPIVFSLIFVKDAPKLLFLLLVISLSFSARLRLGELAFREGGAELAIAPLDLPLFGLSLILVFICLHKRQFPKIRLSFMSLTFILFLAAHLISLIPATNQFLTTLEIARLLKMGLLIIITVFFVKDQICLKWIFNTITILILIQGLLAILQFFSGRSFGFDFLGEQSLQVVSKANVIIARSGGTLGHPNVLANFFEAFLPAVLSIILVGAPGAKFRMKYVTISTLFVGAMGIFLTFSRAGWLSLSVGVGIVLFYHRKRLLVKRNLFVVFTALFVALMTLLVFGSTILARITAFNQDSSVFRLLIAETAMNMIRSNPFLGVGANNYLTVSVNYVYLPETSGLYQLASRIVHNLFLLYAAELGLIGLVTFILLLLGIMLTTRQIQMQYQEYALKSLAVGLFAGIVALTIHGMLDWLFRYDPVYTLFWFNLALLISIRRMMSVSHAIIQK